MRGNLSALVLVNPGEIVSIETPVSHANRQSSAEGIHSFMQAHKVDAEAIEFAKRIHELAE